MFRRRRENAPVLDRPDDVVAVVLHALMLSTSLDVLAAAWRSEPLEDERDRIAGRERPAQWLEDIHFEPLVES